ncbi:response regulator [Undibacterium sp. TS12]|uniref:response regulator n=1 Tax=Undibacterium sp. TS12 TaxID=2908202 RepID=UPI001F4C6EEC|nr:response regulator [Undibacterium sp. TS12]MCH8622067.1 response regulator [Undibacterium sp. TS12]
MTKVLLADDDVELVGMLKEYLEREGFAISTVHDGEQAVQAVSTGQYAIAVLDVMMPKMNGIDALRQIRGGSRIPVLMLTARGDDVDRIIGLELGADDYVPKPCTPRELLARLRAILRRTQVGVTADHERQCLVVGALQLWPGQRRAEWNKQMLDLTSTEFTLLELLAKNAGQTVSKSDLSEQGLGRPLARFDRNIDVHLSSIRQKISAFADGRTVIQTVYRQGYMLTRD